MTTGNRSADNWLLVAGKFAGALIAILTFSGLVFSGVGYVAVRTALPDIQRVLGVSQLSADLKSFQKELSAARLLVAINSNETREGLQEIHNQLSSLDSRVASSLGEDRVIREPLGVAYVKEPVYVGGDVELNYVLERTKRGATCIFNGGVPVFTDVANVPVSGDRLLRQRQLTTESTPLKVVTPLPPSLLPGRVRVHLELEYDCDGVLTFDKTASISFTLLPAEERIE